MLIKKEAAQQTPPKAPAIAGLTVLIADEQHLVRGGLKLCLKAIKQDVTVLEAETLESAIEAYRACPAIDLVLLDLSMPGAQGSTALDAFAQSCPGPGSWWCRRHTT